MLLTNPSSEKFKTFFEYIYGIWYNCIYFIFDIFNFFYKYIALSRNKSLSLFSGGASLLIIVGGILDTKNTY